MKLSPPQIRVLEYLSRPNNHIRWLEWTVGKFSWRTLDGKWVSKTTMTMLLNMNLIWLDGPGHEGTRAYINTAGRQLVAPKN